MNNTLCRPVWQFTRLWLRAMKTIYGGHVKTIYGGYVKTIYGGYVKTIWWICKDNTWWICKDNTWWICKDNTWWICKDNNTHLCCNLLTFIYEHFVHALHLVWLSMKVAMKYTSIYISITCPNQSGPIWKEVII